MKKNELLFLDELFRTCFKQLIPMEAVQGFIILLQHVRRHCHVVSRDEMWC